MIRGKSEATDPLSNNLGGQEYNFTNLIIRSTKFISKLINDLTEQMKHVN